MRRACRRSVLFGAVLACALHAWSPGAVALNPELDISQYAHTAWKVRDGFTRGTISTIAQTPDGYLWLGTTFGLVRFDGVRAVPWNLPGSAPGRVDRVSALLGARNGTLWIGRDLGLSSWNGSTLTVYPEFAQLRVNAMLEDRAGTVWVAAHQDGGAGRLCMLERGRFQCRGEDGSLGPYVPTLFEDSKGRLWGTTADGLWRWAPGPPTFIALPERPWPARRGLAEGENGELLVATRGGVRRIVDGTPGALLVPGDEVDKRTSRILRDRHGALWIGSSNRGLLHVHGGRTDAFGPLDGLSSGDVFDLFEDREGNLWVATLEGLDRFRELAAATITTRQGLPSNRVGGVLPDRDGSVWISTTPGLARWRAGQLTVYREQPQSEPRLMAADATQPSAPREQVVPGLPPGTATLLQDSKGRIWIGAMAGFGYLERDRFVAVPAIAGGLVDCIVEDDAGNLWIAHRDIGLMRLAPDLAVHRIPWSDLRPGRGALRLAVDAVRGGLWLGYIDGSIAHVLDGKVRASYGAGDGLARALVNQIRVDNEGTVWAATEGGLSRLRNGRISTMTAANGLPCDGVVAVIAEDAEAVWLYLACGVARIARAEWAAWAAAADSGAGATRALRVTVFDQSDGVRHTGAFSSHGPPGGMSADGRLWIATPDGATFIDPRRLPHNALPPPVHIEQIVGDRKPYLTTAGAALQLPPLVRDLQIDYTATSLVAPEKVRFRYKLEGQDRDWQDAGTRRQAFYNDLNPGTYRFRVIASNNSGVWNEQGATLNFTIAPAYWQTWWFRALCAAALLLLLWTLYRRRVRQLAGQFNMRLEARVAERTRIARELHDTLLQSFHGLLLRFQTAVELLPNRPREAKQLLVSTIDQASEAITEGRDAVQGLRASTTEVVDLAAAIRALGEELASEEDGDGVLRVEVQGTPRTLHPIVRDEIFRIGAEALRNAFRHAEAKQIEVELRYDERFFRLRVRDDGKGIDATVQSRGGREGHFGMRGMRERATLLGGKLTVWSARHSGTEVELSVPSSHAYAALSSAPEPDFADRLEDEKLR